MQTKTLYIILSLGLFSNTSTMDQKENYSTKDKNLLLVVYNSLKKDSILLKDYDVHLSLFPHESNSLELKKEDTQSLQPLNLQNMKAFTESFNSKNLRFLTKKKDSEKKVKKKDNSIVFDNLVLHNDTREKVLPLKGKSLENSKESLNTLGKQKVIKNQDMFNWLSNLMLLDLKKFKIVVLENKDIIKMKNNNDETLLHKALDRSYKTFQSLYGVYGNEQAQLLLDNGSDVNAQDNKGMSPLHLSIQNGHNDSFIYLMKRTDVNVNLYNNDKQTPIAVALSKRSKECVNMLLARKDINLNCGQDCWARTLVHLSIHANHKECFDHLIKCENLKPNIGDWYGNTPMHHIMMKVDVDNRKEMLESLLKHVDTDPNIQNGEGLTPFESGLSFFREYYGKNIAECATVLINDPRTQFTEKIIKRIIDNDKIESLQQLLLTPHAELVLKCSQYARSTNKDNIANLLENPAPFLQEEAVRKFGTSIANALRVRQITGNTGKIFKTMTKKYERKEKKMIVGLKDMPKTINFNPQKRVDLKIKLRKTSF